MTTPTRSPLRLLIVDDDESLRQTLVRRFERDGITVTAAASAEEALGKLEQTRCDVALLDLHLPGLSGIELLTQLKQRQPHMEAILLTAHCSIETAIQAMRGGAYDYLTKPFHLPELEMYVQKAYEKVQLVRRERLPRHCELVLLVREPEARLGRTSAKFPRTASSLLYPVATRRKPRHGRPAVGRAQYVAYLGGSAQKLMIAPMHESVATFRVKATGNLGSGALVFTASSGAKSASQRIDVLPYFSRMVSRS